MITVQYYDTIAYYTSNMNSTGGRGRTIGLMAFECSDKSERFVFRNDALQSYLNAETAKWSLICYKLFSLAIPVCTCL